ncbi:hypothetical protein M413DRAFT_445942 [Hebeloma cylindrosporum]|uniref:Uncharacterized protein n=1 Tax=Hebeloma cylindrosporum TaxID=76867 RepID=A0A0C3CA61_HEBCY|nr:hypothetical protein M413DRAFT_445942 [Hebeloma cylindrosporum h7]
MECCDGANGIPEHWTDTAAQEYGICTHYNAFSVSHIYLSTLKISLFNNRHWIHSE